MAQNSETPVGYSGSPTVGYTRDGAGLDAPRVSLAEIEAMGVAARPEPVRRPDGRSAPIPAHIADRVAAEASFDPATAGLSPEKPGAVVSTFLECVRLIDSLQRAPDRGRVSRALAAFFGAL